MILNNWKVIPDIREGRKTFYDVVHHIDTEFDLEHEEHFDLEIDAHLCAISLNQQAPEFTDAQMMEARYDY